MSTSRWDAMRSVLRLLFGTFERPPQEEVQLIQTGFRFYRDGDLVGEVSWDDIVLFEAYKQDFLTIDYICFEITLSDGTVWDLHEEVGGFWALASEIKSVFPDSRQRWEEEVAKPAFVENRTILYTRPGRTEALEQQ